VGAPRLALEHRLDTGSPPPPAVPAGVTLDEVTDEEGRLDYLAVTVDAYADSFLPRDAAEAQIATLDAVRGPAVRAVVARDDGRPVSAAMVVGSGAVAGIQLVGTVPDARGRGLGELCTRWAVGVGFDLGAHAIVLEASEAGEPLYLRLGFVEISRYRWCFGPPS
jgi:predicted GNAT family acetyltransferase